MPLRPSPPSSGRVLSYCAQQVTSFREHISISLCVFKVGVTSNPVVRYVDYRRKNFTAMWVIFCGSSVKEIHMLEAALVSLFHSCSGCQNTPGSGGEGALNRVSSVPPYYAYVTGGRADQHCRAPCSHAVELAKASVEDSPNDISLLPPALREFASIREKDAEEACHKLFKKYGLTVPVEIETIDAGNEGELKKLPVVKISTWAKYLLDSGRLEQLTGVPEPEMEPRLEEFWQRYRKLYPEHQVYVLAENQIVRKPNIKRDPMGMNYIGSTWSTHFAFGSLLRSYINKDASCLDKLMAAFGQDMTDLATQGVWSENGEKRLWIQILGVKGDLPALGKIGNFVRNYSRVPKKPSSKTPCVGICWLCKAGQEHPVHIPFEDFRPAAAWKTTAFAERPWQEEPPILAAIPGLPDKPEAFFVTDFWHNFHNGLGKFWVANALAMFIYRVQIIPERSIEKKLEWLSADFISYCSRVNITPFMKEFTRDNLSMDSFDSYPQGLWSKAEVTTQTMLYLQDLCERFIEPHTPDKIFSGIAEATRLMNTFISVLYGEGFWIPAERGGRLGRMLEAFMVIYQACASEAVVRGIN
ncbi:unnamed protein product, partial [Symbiodinium necroappetens]